VGKVVFELYWVMSLNRVMVILKPYSDIQWGYRFGKNEKVRYKHFCPGEVNIDHRMYLGLWLCC